VTLGRETGAENFVLYNQTRLLIVVKDKTSAELERPSSLRVHWMVEGKGGEAEDGKCKTRKGENPSNGWEPEKSAYVRIKSNHNWLKHGILHS